MIEFERYDPETGLLTGKTVVYDSKIIKAIEEADYGCNILIGKEWVASIEDYQVMKAKRDGRKIGYLNTFGLSLSHTDLSDIGRILYETSNKRSNPNNN